MFASTEHPIRGCTTRIGTRNSRRIFATLVAIGALARGWTNAGNVSFSDVAPQSEATPIVNRIKNEGINLVWSTSTGIGTIMAEAKIQGVDMSKVIWVWTSQCETPAFLKQNPDASGVYVSQLLTPPSDTKVIGVANYIVLEFVRGRSLRDMVNQGSVPLPQTFAVWPNAPKRNKLQLRSSGTTSAFARLR